MFWLKKTLGYLLMPLQLSLLLMAIGLWLGWRSRGPAGRVWLVCGVALLAVTSNKMVGNWLIGPLESHYSPVPELSPTEPLPANLAAVRYIAVLGGGHANMSGVAATNQLSSSALARLTEGVRLTLRLPEGTLLVCGPGPPGQATHAEVLRAAAMSLGLPEERIVLVPDVRDTATEIAALRQIAGEERLALVTSAWHMPRAMTEARTHELRAVACPTDYAYRRKEHFEWSDLLWDMSGLDRSTKAIHERLGQFWARLLRSTTPRPAQRTPAVTASVNEVGPALSPL